MSEFIRFKTVEENGSHIISAEIDNSAFKDKLFYDVKYALFSTISPKSLPGNQLCTVLLNGDNTLEFRTKDTTDENEEKLIKECRDIAYAYLMFACIPIVIQSHQERLESSYFIETSSSAFHKFPGLARIVYPEDIKNLSIIFNPKEKFYNEVGYEYAKAMGGLSPVTNRYRVSFFNNVEMKDLHRHPRPNNKIPSYANLCTKDNFVSIIPEKYSTECSIAQVNPPTHIFKDHLPCFYVTSYVDIGFPEETMIAASASSNALFLTPDHGQVRYAQNKAYNYFKDQVLRFSFRSKNYDDPYQNMLCFAAALSASTNVVIPITAPCYDVIKMLSLYVERYNNFKKPEYTCKKRIIFFIDLHYKGNDSIQDAIEIEFNRIIKTFGKMEVFKTLNKIEFVLFKSLRELVKYLSDEEDKDLRLIYGNEDIRKQKIVKYDDIRSGLKLYFGIDK